MDNTDQIDHAEHDFWRNRCPECETNGGCEHSGIWWEISKGTTPFGPCYGSFKGVPYRVILDDIWWSALVLHGSSWNEIGRACNVKGAKAICESHSRGW